MSPSQGWFESDDDYRMRVAREANERTIGDVTGEAPSQGWFESDESYRDRIADEANEHRIAVSTGETPSQGWFESDESYRDRIADEANAQLRTEVVWTCRTTGSLGTGHQLTITSLPVGEHLISVYAPDGIGGEVSASVQILVIPDKQQMGNRQP